MTTPIRNLPPNQQTSTSELIPDYAHTVLVPIANPSTASDLLHLAAALAHPDDGHIIALTVSIGGTEAKAEDIEKLKTIIAQIENEGYKISLEIAEATSIARGILDTTAQNGADLLILGIHQPVRGQVILGTVVENVLETAPCDVLIYRRAAKADFTRVVVPIEDTFQTQVAALMGMHLAKRYSTSIEAMYVQSSGHSQFEGLAHIEQAIMQIPGRESVKRTVITAQNAVEAVLTRTTDDDLIIVGFDERNELERWMYGDMSNNLLNKAEGPVIVVARSGNRNNAAKRYFRRLLGWLRPELTRIEQDDIVRQSADMASFNIDYMILIFISATIASLGLLLNSAAVIIGAMLVAPLMSPLIAFSASMTVGRVRIVRRSFITTTVGFIIALLLAVFLGWVLPINTPTVEMLARGRPTLLDAGVALASGIVGAYATARKDIPAALAGVAIAAALMPPICTVGLAFAFGDLTLAFGALLLFITNIIYITLAGIIVFAWLGMNLRRYPDVPRMIQLALLGVYLLAAVPVGLQLITITQRTTQEGDIRQRLESALDPAELTEFDVKWASENPSLSITHIYAAVRSSQELEYQDLVEIEAQIASVLGERVALDLIMQPIIRLNVAPEINSEATSEMPSEAEEIEETENTE